MTKIVPFAAHKAAIADSVKASKQVFAKAKESLQEVLEAVKTSDETGSQVTEKASSAALILYKARADNQMSQEEVSSLLGDVFGYRLKPDGKPSKTPNKAGETIRQRVVRAVQARDFVLSKGENRPRWAEGVSVEAVATEVEAIENGKTTIYTAYETLGKMKEKPESVPLAYDPSRINKIVAELSKPEGMEAVRKSPALMASYSALIELITGLEVDWGVEEVKEERGRRAA